MNQQKVNQSVENRYREENIGEEEYEWILHSNTRPGKAYANIKTHKEHWLYRYIISSIGTAIEKLAPWAEFHIKPLAKSHLEYIKYTGHLLNHIEEINTAKRTI